MIILNYRCLLLMCWMLFVEPALPDIHLNTHNSLRLGCLELYDTRWPVTSHSGSHVHAPHFCLTAAAVLACVSHTFVLIEHWQTSPAGLQNTLACAVQFYCDCLLISE